VRWTHVPFLAGSLPRARRAVAVSKATADDLRFHFPQAFRGREEKLRVIHHGVSPAFRPADDEERMRIRHELGLPGGYLLYAGTLEPRKNVEGVLDAWLALRGDDPATPPLVLAGGYGWRSKGLIRKIERVKAAGGPDASDLHVLGRVSDDELARLYRAATVFLYPSFYEGFGMPVLAAMASGVPVVTSDRSSLPEVAGGAAIEVRPEDPGQLGGAVRNLLAEPNLAQDLAARGLERASGFRWERAAAEMEEVFLEALG
jgi:alpha-1,3-rhamnosyl/mannosyltransferase